MRKVLPLLSLTAILAVGALAQPGSYVFSNGPTAPSSMTSGGAPYYCVAAQTFDSTGNYTGYIGFFFSVKPDGTFSAGHVYVNDAGGNVLYTADNFSGTKVGNLVSGVFSGQNFTGSVNEAMGTKRGRCYKGSCGTVTYITSGVGAYLQN